MLTCIQQYYSTTRTKKPPLEDTSTSDINEQRPLDPPNAQQREAIETLLETRQNIVFDACAGSGKTTSILHLAKAAAERDPKLRFLVLTYNRRLAAETRARAKKHNLQNLKIVTHHALGVEFYTRECSTNWGLRRVVRKNMPIITETLPEYDILVIDEQQDMTPAIKSFLDKFLRDTGLAEKGVRVIALGDPGQEIYGFNDADCRFLKFVSDQRLFGYLNKEDWKKITLRTSHRLTEPNVRFVNEVILKPSPGEEIIAAPRDGAFKDLPRYVFLDIWKATETIKEILRLLELGYKPGDIMVLAPSVNSSAVKRLADLLSSKRYRIPVHISDSYSYDTDADLSKNKILFSSFHQSKGLERAACFIFNFDLSYHLYFDRTPEYHDRGSNVHYVAFTRCLKIVVIFHHYKQPKLPFVPEIPKLNELCTVVYTREWEAATPKEEEGRKRQTPEFSVTDLIRNLPDQVVERCLKKLEYCLIDPPMRVKEPSTIIADVHNLSEGVAAITGTATTGIIELEYFTSWNTRDPSLIWNVRDRLKQALKKSKVKEYRDEFRPLYEKVDEVCNRWTQEQKLDLPDILFLANIKNCCENESIYKLLTIPLDSYNWMTDAERKDIINTLRHIPKWGVKYEFGVKHEFPDIVTSDGSNASVKISGNIDFYSQGQRKLWENKHTTILCPQDVLQTILYKILVEAQRSDDEPIEAFLCSSKSGQLLTVGLLPGIKPMDIIQDLVMEKTGQGKRERLGAQSDEYFLDQCERGFPDYVTDVSLPEWFNMEPQEHKIAHRVKKFGAQKARSL